MPGLGAHKKPPSPPLPPSPSRPLLLPPLPPPLLLLPPLLPLLDPPLLPLLLPKPEPPEELLHAGPKRKRPTREAMPATTEMRMTHVNPH